MKWTFIILFFSIILISCDKTVDWDEQMEIDRKIIEEYVADNNIPGFFTDDEQNIYVSIEKEGTGDETPTPASTVEIIYKGYMLDGTVFDTSDGFPVSFPVWQLIQGWQVGLGYFKRGSEGKLIIPSRLAYSTRGTPNGSIPPNTVIAFDIELLNF